MSDEFFGDRRRALEESFFAERDRQLLDQLRNRVIKEELAKASGIKDDAVLQHLVAANISGETVACLALVPLVAVAWADGELDEKERRALLSAVEEEGIAPGSVPHRLVAGWLQQAPGPQLVSAWKEYIAVASKSWSPAATITLRDDVLGRAQKIARAAGGLLGLGKISAEEQAVLDDLRSAFSA